jgi:hypothetical protein
MNHGALQRKYIDPGHRRGPVSRQTIALAALVVVVLFGNKAVDVLGTEPDVLWGVAAILVPVGAAAGALFHPVVRFRWRGAISGVVVAGGAFAAQRLYSRLRPEQFGHEFAVVALVGALPGVALYYLLMRGQTLRRDEHGKRNDGAVEQGDEADER